MKKTIALIVATAVAPAWAAAPPTIDKLVDCAAVGNAQDRLACFDREIAPFAKGKPAAPSVSSAAPPARVTPAPVAPSRPAAVAATPPAAPAAAPSSFGQEQLKPEQRAAPKEEELTLHATLTSQRSAGGGMFNLYLDNGQVWRHEDPRLGEYLRDGEAVTIEKGVLGSYRLSRDAGKSKNWIRVTRVR